MAWLSGAGSRRLPGMIQSSHPNFATIAHTQTLSTPRTGKIGWGTSGGLCRPS